MKRIFLGLLVVSFALCFSAPGRAAAPSTSAPPNVIVILTDDQGYADTGFHGSNEIVTPHLDRLAESGVICERGYVSAPVCGPSRAGLLTGRYQQRFGFYFNANCDPHSLRGGMVLSEKMIPAVIKPAGYHSMAIGKWHQGGHPDQHPMARGFDEFFGFLEGHHNYFCDQFNSRDIYASNAKAKASDWHMLRGREEAVCEGYLTDVFSDEAVSFIQRQTDQQPFFLYLAYNAPHTPLHAPQKYLDRFPHIKSEQRRTYAAMLSAVDDGVGRVLKTLSEQGLTENTLVIYLSDNGGTDPHSKGWNGSDNAPLRGAKGSPWEGGLRVPFVISWPGKLPSGVRYPHPVISLDILATICGINKMDEQSLPVLDGVNLIPYLQDTKFERQPHEHLFLPVGQNGSKVLIEHQLKYLVDRSKERQLYDLEKDISESTNVIDSHSPDRVDDLHQTFVDWEADKKGPSTVARLRDRWQIPETTSTSNQ